MLLSTKWNSETGGFGLWDSKDTSVFHSSLILGLFGKMKDVVTVDKELLNKIKNYVLSYQLDDGSFAHSKGSYTPFPSLLSPLATSIYVFQSMSLAKITNEKLLKYIMSNLSNYKSDIALLSMVLQGSIIYPDIENFQKILYNILLSSQQPDGSWSNNSSSTLTTSKVSTETTAYALIAINELPFTENDDAAFVSTERGVEYLLSQRTNKGWESTRDTLYNILAFSSIKFLMPSFTGLNGTITYLLNGEKLAEWTITPESTDIERLDIGYQLRKFFVPPEKLIVGENTLEVRCMKETGAHLIFERDVYPPIQIQQLSKIDQTDKIGHLKVTHSSPELMIGNQNEFIIEFNPSKRVEALMLEIPIPSGCNLTDNTLNSNGGPSTESVLKTLRNQNKDFDHFELKMMKGEQRLCCHSSLVNQKILLRGAFVPSFSGHIQMNSPIAYPMYQPSIGVEGQVAHFVVKAN